MRVVLYLTTTILVLVAVVGGLLATSHVWLSLVNTAFGSQLEANKFLVIIPAAVATLVAALFNGVSVVITANMQRKTTLQAAKERADFEVQLEQKRQDAVDTLEKKKLEFTKSLEDHKIELARGLDEHRDALERLNEARELAASYRYEIGLLQMGTYSPRQTGLLRQKLHNFRDSLDRNEELYRAWCEFIQWGYFLEESAKGKRPTGQHRVWLEIQPDNTTEHVGLRFAQSAERVLAELNAKREQVRSKK